MLTCTVASAQNVTVVTQPISTALTSAYSYVGGARNWTGTDYDLSVVAGDTTLAFVAIDHSDFVNGVSFPTFSVFKANVSPKIHGITDYCIVGDSAFFCGYRQYFDSVDQTYKYTYYIGYFDMNELITGPNVHYTLMKVPDAYQLTRIEGFNDAYGFRVFVLGTHWDTINHLYSHRIYEIDNSPTATGYNYDPL